MPGARLSNSRGKEAETADMFNEAQRLGVAGATGERQDRCAEAWRDGQGLGHTPPCALEDPGLEPGGDRDSALWDGCSLLGSPSADTLPLVALF